MIFALVGNQNCGKTTLFNALTGSNQHVGNFPGVTVDQKMGEMRDEKGCSVVDLPGIYSLRPYTQEEIVSRDFIINQKPDGIINIVDATNIERNLYLTLQLLELRVPMVLALNMMDEVRANGGAIDVQKMSQALGIPVVPISAAKGEGVSELVDQAHAHLPVAAPVRGALPYLPYHRLHVRPGHVRRARQVMVVRGFRQPGYLEEVAEPVSPPCEQSDDGASLAPRDLDARRARSFSRYATFAFR